jgi:hypothetical protein
LIKENEEKMKSALLLFILILLIAFFGCENEPDIVTVPDEGTQITVNLQNLPAIGDTVSYVVWLYYPVVTEVPVKVGVIDNVTAQTASKTFPLFLTDLRTSSSVVITIQSPNDTVPGATRVMAGTIQANSGQLNISNALAVGAALDSAQGNYTLFTPTDTLNAEQRSGVWFVNYNGGDLLPGLVNMPVLAAGWRYEGRVEVGGIVLSTGRFTNPNQADAQAPYSGTHRQIGFPGEDFLYNSPAGITFPFNLGGARLNLVIVPNNNVSSEGITIMSADIPADAAPFTTYGMNLNPIVPSGSFNIDVSF